jgi:hypothetical protein
MCFWNLFSLMNSGLGLQMDVHDGCSISHAANLYSLRSAGVLDGPPWPESDSKAKLQVQRRLSSSDMLLLQDWSPVLKIVVRAVCDLGRSRTSGRIGTAS